VQVAFPADNVEQPLAKILADRDLRQFHTAETEKYAHVTFFFNGGREAPFKGEDRVLIPSPKDVPTYDLKPEMSAFAVADEAAKKIREGSYDFVLMNFANADMVGHTGNYEAAIRAMEALDQCLAKVVGAAQNAGYDVLITSDRAQYGNRPQEYARPPPRWNFGRCHAHALRDDGPRSASRGHRKEPSPM